MSNQRHRKIPALALLVFFLVSIQCAGTAKKESAVTDEQKEKDLIELLNARQVKPPEMLTEAEKQQMEKRIAELEEMNKSKKEEIDALKSEILLKDEKIRQLESQKVEKIEIVENPIAQITQLPPPPVEVVKEVAAPASFDFSAEYKKALDTFMAREYKKSVGMFSVLLEKDAKHPLSENCQYWIGEGYYGLKDYKNSIIAFEKVFTFPSSNKDDDAQLKLGYCYYELGDLKRAREEFVKLINNYPKSEYINRANRMLEKIKGGLD